jgi:hypothetical protein
MKKLFALLLLCLVPFSLATVSVTSTLVTDAVSSNPEFENSGSLLDDTDDLSYVSIPVQVSVTNQTVDVQSVTVTYPFSATLSGSVANEPKTRVTFTPRTVTNDVLTFTVEVLVPQGLDAIDSSFNAVTYKVPVTVQTSAGTQVVDASFQIENKLYLDSLEVDFASDTYDCDVDNSVSLDCDEDLDELPVRSGSMTVTMEVVNDNDEDSKLDFEDVSFDIDSDNRDVDVDDNSFDESIDADETVEVSFTVDVSSKVEDGDDVKVTVEASIVDDNGARHGFKHTFTAEFQQKDYDLEAGAIVLSNPSVCQNDITTATIQLTNIGSKDQKNVRIQTTNAQLGLNDVKTFIQVKEEATSTQSIQIPVKSTVRPGSYPIQALIYYESEDDDDEQMLRSATLVVEDCSKQTTQPVTPVQPTTPTTNVTKVDPTLSVTQPQLPVITQKQDNSILYLGSIAVVLIIVILVLFGLLFKR